MNHRKRKVLRAVFRGTMIAFTAVLLTGCAWLCRPDGVTIDFGTLTNNAVYGVGDSFTIGDIVVKVLPFEWSNETVYSGGILTVDDQLSAGGSGLDLNLNNVCLGFDFGRSIREISLKFGEYGGNINVQTNGDFVNQGDFYGMALPGISLTITDLGGQKGSIIAAGVMERSPFVLLPDEETYNFVIGGQELWIDDIEVLW